MNLNWAPQEAFVDFFEMDPQKVMTNRSLFNSAYSYFVAYGGRGSGKTFTFSDAVVLEGTLRPIRILITREIQNSIAESIKSEIENVIEARGLSGSFYTIKKDYIVGANGTRFMFKGLKNNITSIKSISDVDVVLCEESENVSKKSWDVFLPSIRPRSGRPPIVIVIFNPNDELDDTWTRFMVSPPPRTISRLINWKDNAFFPDYLNELRLECLKTRPRKEYDNIWEGVPVGNYDNCIINRDWIRAARFASRQEGFIKTGKKVVGYDPAGQGRDYHAVVVMDGNVLVSVDEWPLSDDLRKGTRRAMESARTYNADKFSYDECGGYGDGVSVFVNDIVNGRDPDAAPVEIDVSPFNAGAPVVDPDDKIPGTDKTNAETYVNLKAQTHGITAQRLYNTYRFVVLKESVDPKDMLSIDIANDEVFTKLVRELSAPLWVRSAVNGKLKVESKDAMEKRTGQVSPNIADALHMTQAPTARTRGFFDVFMEAKKAQGQGRAGY